MLIAAALLVPSAWFAWTYRDMPHFGDIHDDAIYLSVAKAIASGEGYRTPDFPGNPWQTKYPPLYPLYLAVTWLWNPAFPSNLGVAAALSWLPVVPMLFLSRLFFTRTGFRDREAWCLTALVALNPLTLLFSVSLRPEPLFTCFLLAAVLLAERPAWAGVLSGLGFLVRSAGVAALPAFAMVYLLRRGIRDAIVFAGCMLPAVLGWMWWANSAKSGATDIATLYYFDYFGLQTASVQASNLLRYLWINFGALISGIGGLFLTDVDESPLVLSLTRLLAVAAIAGVYRMRKQPFVREYAAFALLSSVMLVAWNYPPNARFVYPLFPLLAAGLWTEIQRFLQVLRSTPSKTAAYAVALVVAAIGIFAVYSQFRLASHTLPETMAGHRALRPEIRDAFLWLKTNTPAEAKVLCWKDPLVYLYADRQSLGLVYPTTHFYEARHDRVVDEHRATVDFARRYSLDYILVHKRWHGDLTMGEHAEILEILRSRSDLKPVYRSPQVVIYQIKNASI